MDANESSGGAANGGLPDTLVLLAFALSIILAGIALAFAGQAAVQGIG